MDPRAGGETEKDEQLAVYQAPHLRRHVEKAESHSLVSSLEQSEVGVLEDKTLRIRVGKVALLDVLTQFSRRAVAVREPRTAETAAIHAS
jgi:hypothetical protein